MAREKGPHEAKFDEDKRIIEEKRKRYLQGHREYIPEPYEAFHNRVLFAWNKLLSWVTGSNKSMKEDINYSNDPLYDF